jgi:signal transduction histidine kinase
MGADMGADMETIGTQRAAAGAIPARRTDTDSVVRVRPLTETRRGLLPALGRLAAEVAHDLNNQLAVITNYGFILERQLAGTPQAMLARELRDAAWRASATARRLKAVARPRDLTRGVALDELILDLRPLLAHLAQDATLRVDLELGLPDADVERSFMEQLVVGEVLVALAHAPAQGEIVVWAKGRPRSHDADGPRVRLGCSVTEGLGELHGNHSWVAPGDPVDRAALHRAIKRCRGRLGRDDHSVWVDLPVC